MLMDKALKKKQKEIVKMEAEWSQAQHDVIRSKITISDSDADILAREQTKNKALKLCMENGKRFKYNSPVSLQEDVNQMFNKIQKLSEPDQLSVMRREIKLKKILFSDLPSDFPMFRQYNITAKVMYQNLLQLHSVDESNQETVSVEDIYDITESLATVGKCKAKKVSHRESSSEASSEADIIWPPHEDDFIITLDEGGWNLGSVQGYNPESDTIEVQCLITLKTRVKDDHGKTYWMYVSDDQHEIFR